jgi:hypothetical protein
MQCLYSRTLGSLGGVEVSSRKGFHEGGVVCGFQDCGL